MQTFSYAVSFEYDLRPVQTARGTVRASSTPSGCRMAAKKATVELKPNRWRSMVVVLERIETETASVD